MANPMMDYLKNGKSKKKKKGEVENKKEDIAEGGTDPKAMKKVEAEEVD